MKAKRAKLEQWKKDREAKKALDEAKAKAMALAAKSGSGESFTFVCCALRDFTSLDPPLQFPQLHLPKQLCSSSVRPLMA